MVSRITKMNPSTTSKLKVLRVVTTHECVPWHMGNTLIRMTNDFDVYVAGQGVSAYANIYPEIKWIDLKIERQFSPFHDVRAILKLCRTFIELRPDIVHSIMPKAGLLTAISGLICRVPVRIHTFTGQVWATKQGVSRLLLKTIDRFIILVNTLCLTDSPSQSEFLYQQNISFNGQPIPVLSKGSLSGVDVARFSYDRVNRDATKLRIRLGVAESDFVFSFIARKSRDKGAYEIIQAFSELLKSCSNVKLLFVGPDESNGELSKLIIDNPTVAKHIIDVDRVSNHELYLAISDVLCLPSYREGFGSIVIDAAALSIPTIGSDVPGLVDSIDNNVTGVLIRAGDTNELVVAMKSFIDNPDDAKSMGKEALERVMRFFTADILYDSLKDTYVRLSIKRH
ncbi:MAG: glycosyltransferase family 1 protein [Methylophaga sp.]|nr:MAG: glycosyltransferase family 1 protein [Methylophaga sp.]